MRLTGVEYEAAMYGRTAALLFAATLLGFAGGIASYARGAGQAPAADQSLSHEERARLLAKGKELFLARCARCHDERGDKPLKTGPAIERAGALHRRDCPGGERAPPRQDRGRTTRGDTLHFELDENQRFGRKGSTKSVVPRHPHILKFGSPAASSSSE